MVCDPQLRPCRWRPRISRLSRSWKSRDSSLLPSVFAFHWWDARRSFQLILGLRWIRDRRDSARPFIGNVVAAQPLSSSCRNAGLPPASDAPGCRCHTDSHNFVDKRSAYAACVTHFSCKERHQNDFNRKEHLGVKQHMTDISPVRRLVKG